MHRKAPATTLLYQYLYPRPTPNDPNSFSNHLARNLIPEIRCETARFYGSLDSTEARYPGLNYTHIPHIRRLAHFPHHARLFRAIKVLGITDTEVLDMARWEGTLWARERFEKDEDITVADTTGDGIFDWVDPRLAKKATIVATTTLTLTSAPSTHHLPSPQSATHCELEVQEPGPDRATMTASPAQIGDDDDDSSPSTVSPPLSARRNSLDLTPLAQSAAELFEQIMSVVARYQRGEDVNLPSDLEAWVDELCNNWTALQEQGSMADNSLTGVRDFILGRIEELQERLPTTLNLASALSLMVEERMRLGSRAEETAVVVGEERERSRVITQPAA